MSKRGLMILFLPLLLSACATTTVTERVYPPAHLIQNCPEPQMYGDTNGALARYAIDLRAALRSCNADKAGLRTWADGK